MNLIEPTEFNVFYSWQSDLPCDTNRNAIRSALRVASSKFEIATEKFRIVLDEATRGEPGSPNIPEKILEKIKSCDVFVCDVTTINSMSDLDFRRTPNPNVLFELGYAVAYLGWPRIIMLFNEEFGSLNHVPFDIAPNRVTKYRLSSFDPKNKGNHSQLAASLTEGLLTIAKKEPNRPLDEIGCTPEKHKLNRDIKNLKWLLGSIHFPTLDEMIRELPDLLNSRALHFWEGFNEVVNNSLFHLYDTEAMATISSMREAWYTCVSNGEQYHIAVNPDIFVFRNLGDAPFSEKQDQVWERINTARATLHKSMAKLLAILRSRYIEIDLDEMNSLAWHEYVEFHREMELQIERKET